MAMECHHITEANSIFFHNNTVKSCIGLTATPPTDLIKIRILSSILKFNYAIINHKVIVYPTYQVTLDEAVELGIVAPYDITVIQMPLNNTVKYIKGGFKNNPKIMTEKERYDELTRLCDFGSNPMRHIMRMRFIYELLSKTQTAVKILEHIIPKDIKTLIFCGSKDQANQVCPYRYYSKPTPPKKLSVKDQNNPTKVAKYREKAAKYMADIQEYQGSESYNLFFEDQINQLSSCEALNEGLNMPLVDCAFIIQLNASEKDLVQRMGRILRQRDGHTGKIIVLVAEGTKDIDWANKALSKLDITRINWTTLQDLKTGKYIINF